MLHALHHFIFSCCLVTMRPRVQVLETASCRNAGKGCVLKTQSGRTLPRTPAQAGATCTGLLTHKNHHPLSSRWITTMTFAAVNIIIAFNNNRAGYPLSVLRGAHFSMQRRGSLWCNHLDMVARAMWMVV